MPLFCQCVVSDDGTSQGGDVGVHTREDPSVLPHPNAAVVPAERATVFVSRTGPFPDQTLDRVLHVLDLGDALPGFHAEPAGRVGRGLPPLTPLLFTHDQREVGYFAV